jgi:SAM-dependent methyltransferase
MGGPIRCDFGAGHKKEPGWVALDLKLTRQKIKDGHVVPGQVDIAPDIECDLMAIPLPDNYADEARAIHVIEHFQPWDAPTAMREWVRVLKPGAELAIECPCLDKIVKLFDVPNIPPYMTYWGLYGDPRLEDPLMMHHWCYSETQLMRLMQKCGLINLHGQPPRFHQLARDMRIVGAKPATGPRIQLPE